MIPTLLDLGPIPVRSFGLMVALALVVGALRLARSFSRYNLNPLLAEKIVTTAGISGLLGARLWYLGENWRDISLPADLFATAGFTFYGGFIVAAVAVYIQARRERVPVATLCDALGPCLALGYAVGRLGCQLSGDGDYGIETSSWWGMSYATGVVPTPPGVLAYPTPLFESAISIFVLFILSKVEASSRVLTGPLQRFGLYLALISVERFGVEFFRINPRSWGGLSEAQVIALGLLSLGALLIGFGARRRPTAAISA